jgi:predicted RNase H-like HicB family nuclease
MSTSSQSRPAGDPGRWARIYVLVVNAVSDRLIGVHSTFTAITKKDGDWWIGWIEEVPGVNAQEETKEKLISSLREILPEALEFRALASLAGTHRCHRVAVSHLGRSARSVFRSI